MVNIALLLSTFLVVETWKLNLRKVNKWLDQGPTAQQAGQSRNAPSSTNILQSHVQNKARSKAWQTSWRKACSQGWGWARGHHPQRTANAEPRTFHDTP